MITEDGKFKRDTKNRGALISTDLEGLKAYKLRKKKFKDLDDRINNIENTLGEILSIIKDAKK
jgi:hypothetical protein